MPAAAKLPLPPRLASGTSERKRAGSLSRPVREGIELDDLPDLVAVKLISFDWKSVDHEGFFQVASACEGKVGACPHLCEQPVTCIGAESGGNALNIIRHDRGPVLSKCRHSGEASCYENAAMRFMS